MQQLRGSGASRSSPSNESNDCTADIDTERPDKITCVNMMNILDDVLVINTQIGLLGLELFRAKQKAMLTHLVYVFFYKKYICLSRYGACQAAVYFIAGLHLSV